MSVRKPEEAHVVMLAQYLPLHFVSTMKHLAQRVGKLSLLLSQPMDASRDWAPDFADLNVHLQRSWQFGVTHRHPLGFADQGTVIIPHSTRGDLKRLKPDVVISVEVGARTMQAAALKAMGMPYKLIVQVRESENTAQSRGAARRRLRSFLLPRADGVFANGESGRRHVLDCGVKPDRVSIVPSGTDLDVFGATLSGAAAVRANGAPERLAGAEDVLRLLYVGQLIPRKGLIPFAQELIATWTYSKRPIEWTLAGRGPLEAELRALPWPEHVQLKFVGSKPYRELPQVYAAADIFVMPSLSDEWGMVVNEAMASGLPVLGCTGVQAVDEMVTDGISGWTFAPGNRPAVQRGLARALLASPTEIGRMGENARAKALEISDRYTAEAMAGGVAKALGGARPPGAL